MNKEYYQPYILIPVYSIATLICIKAIAEVHDYTKSWLATLIIMFILGFVLLISLLVVIKKDIMKQLRDKK
jgi:uncharacterized membrane protein